MTSANWKEIISDLKKFYGSYRNIALFLREIDDTIKPSYSRRLQYIACGEQKEPLGKHAEALLKLHVSLPDKITTKEKVKDLLNYRFPSEASLRMAVGVKDISRIKEGKIIPIFSVIRRIDELHKEVMETLEERILNALSTEDFMDAYEIHRAIDCYVGINKIYDLLGKSERVEELKIKNTTKWRKIA